MQHLYHQCIIWSRPCTVHRRVLPAYFTQPCRYAACRVRVYFIRPGDADVDDAGVRTMPAESSGNQFTDGTFLLLYRHALDIRRCRLCTAVETATPPEPSSLTITLYGVALFSWIDMIFATFRSDRLDCGPLGLSRNTYILPRTSNGHLHYVLLPPESNSYTVQVQICCFNCIRMDLRPFIQPVVVVVRSIPIRTPAESHLTL